MYRLNSQVFHAWNLGLWGKSNSGVLVTTATTLNSWSSKLGSIICGLKHEAFMLIVVIGVLIFVLQWVLWMLEIVVQVKFHLLGWLICGVGFYVPN
jgi:hypothetical protein